MSLREEVLDAALANIHDDPQNLKTHSDANLSHIKASIERFGFVDPVGVVENPDQVAGGYMIVEGHGRLAAARELKMATVPVIVLDLDEIKRKGYGIAHNQTQQITGMDGQAVANEFQRLNVGAEDYNALGYSEEDAMFLPSPTAHTEATFEGDQFSGPEGEYEEQEDSGGIGVDRSVMAGYVPVVHKSALRFGSDTSYNRFLELQMQLFQRYPTAGSVGERVKLLIQELKGETEGDEHEHAAADA